MTLDEAVKKQKEAYISLMAASVARRTLSKNLPPVNGCPVRVREMPRSALSAVVGRDSDGTVMRHGGKYVIFIADPVDSPGCELPSLVGYWLKRAAVLHEYGHIQQGDVFEDDPPRIYGRHQDIMFDWHEVEYQAECWKMHLLLAEAKSAGEKPLVKEILADISQRDLRTP